MSFSSETEQGAPNPREQKTEFEHIEETRAGTITEFDTPEPKKKGKAAQMHSRRLRMAEDVESEYYRCTNLDQKIKLADAFNKLSQAPRQKKQEKKSMFA